MNTEHLFNKKVRLRGVASLKFKYALVDCGARLMHLNIGSAKENIHKPCSPRWYTANAASHQGMRCLPR